MVSTTTPLRPAVPDVRAIAAFTRAARKGLRQAGAAAARMTGAAVRRGRALALRQGATALGAAGCGSIAYGAGMVYTPAGFIVGGALAVLLATRLPGGDPQ